MAFDVDTTWLAGDSCWIDTGRGLGTSEQELGGVGVGGVLLGMLSSRGDESMMDSEGLLDLSPLVLVLGLLEQVIVSRLVFLG